MFAHALAVALGLALGMSVLDSTTFAPTDSVAMTVETATSSDPTMELGVAALGILEDMLRENDAPAGFYPYSVFNREALPIGTPVWTNHGDTKCTYWWEKYPSATDTCLTEYFRAKISGVTTFPWLGERLYFYEVEFEPLSPQDDYRTEREAEFDGAMEGYNLPPEVAAFSKYFIQLNW